jgi:hypothetical protein
MSLEDDLKNQTLAAVAQGVDQWQGNLRRALTQHEETVARSLDALQRAASLDLGSLEPGLAAAISRVVADQPPPALAVVEAPPAEPADYTQLRAALQSIDSAKTLSDAMMALVNESLRFTTRALMLVIKGNTAIGWYGKGIAAEAVRAIGVAVDSGDGAVATVFRSKQPLRGDAGDSASQWAGLPLGGSPGSRHAVPLVLRDRVGAILYTDSPREAAAHDLDSVEILVQYAARVIDLITVQRAVAKVSTGANPAGAPRSGPVAVRPGSGPVPISLPRAGSGPVKVQVPAPRSGAVPIMRTAPPAQAYVAVPMPPPAVPVTVAESAQVVEITEEDGASTLIFDSSTVAALQAPPTPPPVAAPVLSDSQQKAHDQAKRFARLVVSEIKLYNESKVTEGRRNRDLYERLREDIERGRQVYTERVAGDVRESTSYFYDELVRVLAAGDASALGPM